jgi:hypothetical protein
MISLFIIFSVIKRGIAYGNGVWRWRVELRAVLVGNIHLLYTYRTLSIHDKPLNTWNHTPIRHAIHNIIHSLHSALIWDT